LQKLPDKYTEFSLLMNIPNHIANCFIIDNFYSEKSYDVKCSVKGDKSCSEDNNTDFTVDSFEPEPIILSDTNILYYLNFSGQSTIEKTYRHYLKGGILSKKSVTKNGDNILYKFNIEDCKLNQALNTTYKFNIKIHLYIYKDNTINTETNATCIIPKDIVVVLPRSLYTSIFCLPLPQINDPTRFIASILCEEEGRIYVFKEWGGTGYLND